MILPIKSIKIDNCENSVWLYFWERHCHFKLCLIHENQGTENHETQVLGTSNYPQKQHSLNVQHLSYDYCWSIGYVIS